MTLHYLDNWKQYLLQEDYNYLVTFVENIKNGISNDKMIIFSGLQNQVKLHLKMI